MATIHEVAKEANVSVATVSRVLNASENVIPATRLRVQQTIERLNYVPNIHRSRMRVAERKSFLVMITRLTNLFYMETLQGINEFAVENGYDVLLCETNENTQRQIDGLIKVKNHICDGAIILESTVNDKALITLEKKYPVVQCCAYTEGMSIPYVTIDNFRGGYIAARFLLEKGHKNIAFISTDQQGQYNTERRKGFQKRLEEAGIEQDPSLVSSSELSFQGGRGAALELMKLANPPTAMFFVSDMQAIGAINGLLAAGYRIPQDIAVIGFDNIELCNMVVPGLTTVAQPMREIGREAVKLLIEIIRNQHKAISKCIVFQPEIVERGSV